MRLLQVSQWLLLARCHWAICFILSTVARCHNRSMEHRPGPGKMRGLAGTWLSISPWLAQVLSNENPVFRSCDQYRPIRDKYKLGTRQSPGPGSTAAEQTHWAYSSLATLALWDYFTRVTGDAAAGGAILRLLHIWLVSRTASDPAHMQIIIQIFFNSHQFFPGPSFKPWHHTPTGIAVISLKLKTHHLHTVERHRIEAADTWI